MNKILVTGSSGFIGTHLMNKLGDKGIPYDTKEDWTHDVTDYENLDWTISKTSPDCIVHLAAVSSLEMCNKTPWYALETNIIGTWNVLELAKKYKVKRVILASSAATYEPELSLYGTSKLSMELLAKMFDNAYIVRFYNVYGKGSKSVVNKFVKNIKAKKEITLNGNTTRDYVYVDDVVNSLLMMIDQEPLKVMEIGFGKSYSLKELVKVIEKAYQIKADVKQGPTLNEIQQSEMILTWNTFRNIPLEEGVKLL